MRMNPYQADQEAYQALVALEQHLNAGPVPAGTRHLMKVRASQLNGCAYCLEMHTREARDDGVGQAKLDMVAGWRDAEGFSDAERAALAFTEQVTLIADGGVSDDTWQQLSAQYDEKQIAHLLFVVTSINTWNRINVACHVPGRRAGG